MTERTHIDEVVRYPDLVLYELSQNPQFVSLLLNIPNADLCDDEVMKTWNKLTNNYINVDDTITETCSFCCVDTRLQVDGSEVVDAYIDVLIGVHKDIMSLKTSVFTGMSGNRRDNLIREADFVLHNCDKFGIGKLQNTGFIEPVRTANSPIFSCKVLHYRVSTFGNSRNIDRG